MCLCLSVYCYDNTFECMYLQVYMYICGNFVCAILFDLCVFVLYRCVHVRHNYVYVNMSTLCKLCMSTMCKYVCRSVYSCLHVFVCAYLS